MVFCDLCNICVHQACYGITSIPDGSWLCKTCSLNQRPDCILCPNKGGAMKCTRSGQKWAHVSCALWIPEVSIGSVEKMEPITKISSIPVSLYVEFLIRTSLCTTAEGLILFDMSKNLYSFLPFIWKNKIFSLAYLQKKSYSFFNSWLTFFQCQVSINFTASTKSKKFQKEIWRDLKIDKLGCFILEKKCS